MHPDALIEALQVELEEATDAEHVKAIKAEIERVDKLPRPEAKPEEPETAFDTRRAYIEALKVELDEATDEQHKNAVKAEIKRAEAALKEETVPETTEPSAEEIEQRKKARAGGRRVERATSAPGEERATNDSAEQAE